MDIGKRIAEIRHSKNKRATELAAQIGISKVFLSYLEHGTRKPTLEMLENICTGLGVTLAEFFRPEEKTWQIGPDLQRLVGLLYKLDKNQLDAVTNMIEAFIASQNNSFNQNLKIASPTPSYQIRG